MHNLYSITLIHSNLLHAKLAWLPLVYYAPSYCMEISVFVYVKPAEYLALSRSCLQCYSFACVAYVNFLCIEIVCLFFV